MGGSTESSPYLSFPDSVKKLPTTTKAGYGAAEFGLSGAELMLQLYLFDFYTRVVGLGAAWVGGAMALAILWDAVSDPLMGTLCDRTRGRLGRFLPYLGAGAVVFALGLGLLFTPPTEAGTLVLFGHLLATYLLVNTGLTIVGVPHLAMGSALTQIPHERTVLYGWRLGFSTMGLFAGIGAPLLIVALMGLNAEDPADLYASRSIAAWLMGGVLLIFTGITLAATWSRAKNLSAQAGQSWRDIFGQIATVFRNRWFRILFGSFILVAAARSLNSMLALPFYNVSLQLPEEQVQGPILLTFALVITLAVPAWIYLAKRFGKKRPALAGMALLGGLTMGTYVFFPPGELLGPVLMAVAGGFAVGVIVLFDSLMGDVAAQEKARTGREWDGIYFGFWRMGQKATRGIAAALSGTLFALIGFQEGALEQSDEVARRLAWVFGPGVGAIFLAGAVVFAFFPPLGEEERMQVEG